MRTPRAAAVAALVCAVLTVQTGFATGSGHDPGRIIEQPSAPLVPNGTQTVSSAPTSGEAKQADPRADAAQPVSAVSVQFSEHVRQLAATDPRLSSDALALAIEAQLRAHQLYAPAMPDVHRSLMVTVEGFTNELASNAAVLGVTFRKLGLMGEVQVKEPGGLNRPPFDVHARVRQSHRGSDPRAGSLEPLYARFALQLVADLRGVAAPEEDGPL